MIRLRAVSDVTGAYFLNDPAREVGDLLGSYGPRFWQGRGAGHLGLFGDVQATSFGALLRGQPEGSTLSAPLRRRRSAYDLIIAAPKPVSILFASVDEDVARATLHAHQGGVTAALDYLEVRAASSSRTEQGDRISLPVVGLSAAHFCHGVSRSGDPHLHSHLVIANLAQGIDGRFRSLESRPLWLHLSAADALYRSTLRSELTRSLGVRWQRDAGGREHLSGVSDAAILALSGRSADVRQHSRAVPAKPLGRSRAELRELWEERQCRAPLIENRERHEVSRDHIDEFRFASDLSMSSPRAREVVAAYANAAGAGVTSAVVADVVKRLRQPLGRGAYEERLAHGDVIPASSLVRRLGARPTERGKLAAWHVRADELTRSLSSRTLIGRDRGRVDDLGR